MEKATLLESIIENIGTVLAAIIAAFALAKTSTISYSQKKERATWFFDEFQKAAGRCIENNTVENRQEYKALFMQYYTYASENMRRNMKALDSYIKEENVEKAEDELRNIASFYSYEYDMKDYRLKSKK